MWSKSGKNEKAANTATAPDKLRYSRYYEHDGALRAYANRAESPYEGPSLNP